jgi:stage II sporulation protein D
MINSEPGIRVGILEEYPEVRGSLQGAFFDEQGMQRTGDFVCRPDGDRIQLVFAADQQQIRGRSLHLKPAAPEASFLLHDVTIGVKFHWERKETQTFRGGLQLLSRPGKGLTAVNVVPLEEYLKSVISSEMSATAPPDLLRAHAITSRSWLVAMLDRAAEAGHVPHATSRVDDKTTEITRWYTREDHDLYDVCADDHCQRYQGITRLAAGRAA